MPPAHDARIATTKTRRRALETSLDACLAKMGEQQRVATCLMTLSLSIVLSAKKKNRKNLGKMLLRTSFSSGISVYLRRVSAVWVSFSHGPLDENEASSRVAVDCNSPCVYDLAYRLSIRSGEHRLCGQTYESLCSVSLLSYHPTPTSPPFHLLLRLPLVSPRSPAPPLRFISTP